MTSLVVVVELEMIVGAIIPRTPSTTAIREAHCELGDTDLGLTTRTDLGDALLNRILVVDDDDRQPGRDEEQRSCADRIGRQRQIQFAYR